MEFQYGDRENTGGVPKTGEIQYLNMYLIFISELKILPFVEDYQLYCFMVIISKYLRTSLHHFAGLAST